MIGYVQYRGTLSPGLICGVSVGQTRLPGWQILCSVAAGGRARNTRSPAADTTVQPYGPSESYQVVPINGMCWSDAPPT